VRKARLLVAVLVFVPLIARATCEEGAVLPAAAPPCHGHASDSAPPDPASSDERDCCPACEAFVSAQLFDPVPSSTSLSLPTAPSVVPLASHRCGPVERAPDAASQPLSRENPPLLT
jgi:hypothetical protein